VCKKTVVSIKVGGEKFDHAVEHEDRDLAGLGRAAHDLMVQTQGSEYAQFMYDGMRLKMLPCQSVKDLEAQFNCACRKKEVRAR
jgi:hypothetical protein